MFSAEPLLTNEDVSAMPTTEELARATESSMDPKLLARARAALKMTTGSDQEVHDKMVSHLETCRDLKGVEFLSREDADKEIATKVAEAVAEATKAGEDKITALSRDLEQAKTGARVITIEELSKDVDEDALEMAAGAIKTRIENLGAKATPNQKTMLSRLLVGEEGKRNVVALSRKTASKVGLSKTLSDLILEVFEAGDIAEMQKLLTEQSKGQRRSELARDTNQDGSPDYDPKLTEEMIERMNGSGEAKFHI